MNISYPFFQRLHTLFLSFERDILSSSNVTNYSVCAKDSSRLVEVLILSMLLSLLACPISGNSFLSVFLSIIPN